MILYVTLNYGTSDKCLQVRYTMFYTNQYKPYQQCVRIAFYSLHTEDLHTELTGYIFCNFCS